MLISHLMLYSCNVEDDRLVEGYLLKGVVETTDCSFSRTKASLEVNESGKNQSMWKKGDKIDVSNGIDIFTFTTQSDHNPSADFVYFGNGFTISDGIMAVYPSGNSLFDFDKNIVVANVPAFQNGKIGTFDPQASVAVASSKNGTLKFKNTIALLKFTLKSNNVRSVLFSGNDGEFVAGGICVKLTPESEIVSIDSSSNGETYVEVWASGEKTLESGKDYYMAVVPQYFEHGFKVGIRLNDDNSTLCRVKQISTPYTLERNTIYDLGDIACIDNINDENSDYDRRDVLDFRRGVVANCFSGGDGTVSNPYQISTAAELRYFSDAVRLGNTFKDQYVELVQDITINDVVLDSQGELNVEKDDLERWIPIGRYNPSYFFCGTFDGNNHTISGIYCDRPEEQYVGFFGKMLGTVKNLILRDSYIRGASVTGGIVGSCQPNHISSTIPSSLVSYYNSTTPRASIMNCQNYAKVESGGIAGGIIGGALKYKNLAPRISQCVNKGVIISSGNLAGGIAGNARPDYIADCLNYGIVSGRHNIAGIVGELTEGVVVNSMNRGEVVAFDGNAGGICAYQMNSTIENNVNISTVIGTKEVGSVVGSALNQSVVKNNYCLFAANVAAIGYRYNAKTITNNQSLTDEEIKSVDFIDKLNKYAGTRWTNWKIGIDCYPVLNLNEDTDILNSK